MELNVEAVMKAVRKWWRGWRGLCAPGGTNTSAGQHWERVARAWLERQGLVFVAANVRCRGGELDLIMRDGATIVFVEVRQRSGTSHGGALASIGPAKRRRLARAAQAWLARHPAAPPCRVDVVAIDGETVRWERAVMTEM